MADPIGQYSDDIAAQLGDPFTLRSQTEDNSLTFENPIGNYSESVASELGVDNTSSLNRNGYSLADLEQDEEFNKVASRFLQSVGEKSVFGTDSDIFEYLRDSNYSLSSSMARSLETGAWTEQDKQDYRFLSNKFENADIKTLRHRLKAITDATSDIVFDPFTLAAVLATPFTGGQSLLGRLVLGKAANKAVKDLTTHQLATATGKVTAIEGMAWEGLHNYFNQKLDSKLGMGSTDIDVLEVVGSGALGGIAGGIGGYGVTRALPVISKGLQETKNFVEKTFRFSNEQDIIKEASRGRDIVTKEARLDDVTYGLRGPIGKLSEVLVEKPTTKFIKYAKGSETLQDLLGKIRYDYDDAVLSFTDKTKTRAPKDVRKESYGLAQARRQYSYITNMRKALQTLDRQGFTAHLSTEDNNLLLHLLRNPNTTTYKGKPIKSYLVKASKEIKALLDQTFLDGNKVGVFTDKQKVTNYFPRRFNHSQVTGNRADLEELIIKYGHAEPKVGGSIEDYPKSDFVKGVDAFGKEREILKNTAEPLDVDAFGQTIANRIKTLSDAGNIQEAREIKASAIVDNMLEFKYTPFDFLNRNKSSGGGYGFMKQRVFQDIPDEELAPFLENNVEKVLTDYFTHASQAIERARFFGKNSEDFYDRYLIKIQNELRESGMPKNEVRKLLDDLGVLYGRVTGQDVKRIKDGFIFSKGFKQGFSEWGRLANQMAHLPLATLSSITEPLILFSRVGFKDYGNVTKDIVTSLTQGTKKMLDRSLQTVLRTAGKPFGYKQKGSQAFKDLDDETWSEVYKTGLALEQAVMDRIEGMYGEAFESQGARFLQNAFFSSNLLTQWTGAVQLASFTTGKRLITENLEKLYRNSTGEIKLSKNKQKLLRDQLWELGVDEKKGIKWYESSLKDNVLDYTKSTTGANKAYYENHISAGANRFTKEVILNPNVAEANKPLWFNNPSGQILMQFVGYPTVFNNTVLKRFAKNLTTSQSPQTIATVILMTTGGIIGNAIRSEGRSLEKSDEEIIFDSVQRWGGLGPLEYGLRFQQNAELGGGVFGAAAKIPPGPLVQDVVDSVLYRKGIAETVATNLPGYSAYDFILGEGTQADLKKDARDIDTEFYRSIGIRPPVLKDEGYVQIGEVDRSAQAKGGLVYNVANVHPEPDEVKMRNVNATYNEVAGDILKDEEDRRGFASGLLVQGGKNILKIASQRKEINDILRYLRQDVFKMPPAYRSSDDDTISYLTEEEAKDFTDEVYSNTSDVYYRKMKTDFTEKDHFDDFYYNQIPGVKLTTDPNAASVRKKGLGTRTEDVAGVVRVKNTFEVPRYSFNSSLVQMLLDDEYGIDYMRGIGGGYLGRAFTSINRSFKLAKEKQLAQKFRDYALSDSPFYDKVIRDIYSDEAVNMFDEGGTGQNPMKGFFSLFSNLIDKAPIAKKDPFDVSKGIGLRFTPMLSRDAVARTAPVFADYKVLEGTQAASLTPDGLVKQFFNDMEDFDKLYQADITDDMGLKRMRKDFLDEMIPFGEGDEIQASNEFAMDMDAVGKLYQSRKFAKLLQDLGYDSYSVEPRGLDKFKQIYLLDSSQFKAVKPDLMEGKIELTPKGLERQQPILNLKSILPVYSETYKIINDAQFPKEMTFDEAYQRIGSLPGIRNIEKESIFENLRGIEFVAPNSTVRKSTLLSFVEDDFEAASKLEVVSKDVPARYTYRTNPDPKMHIVKAGKQIEDVVKGTKQEDSMKVHTNENDALSFAIRSRRLDDEGNETLLIDQLQTDLGVLLKNTRFQNSVYKFPVFAVLQEAAQKGIRQVSLIDPISVNTIEGIGLNKIKANRIYSTPKLLETFPVSKDSLDMGTNIKEGLGYKAFKSIVQDLGENPNEVLTYKTFPDMSVVSRPRLFTGIDKEGFRIMNQEQRLKFFDLQKRNFKGELTEQETDEFLNMKAYINQNSEGSFQNKYKLESARSTGLRPTKLPILTIELTDNMIEQLLAGTPARLTKRKGGKV